MRLRVKNLLTLLLLVGLLTAPLLVLAQEEESAEDGEHAEAVEESAEEGTGEAEEAAAEEGIPGIPGLGTFMLLIGIGVVIYIGLQLGSATQPGTPVEAESGTGGS